MTKSELADAMLKGRDTFNVRVRDHVYICTSETTGICRACALGCAFIGMLNGDYFQAEEMYRRKDRESPYSGVFTFAELLDIHPELAIEVEGRHLDGQTLTQIAAWLRGESE